MLPQSLIVLVSAIASVASAGPVYSRCAGHSHSNSTSNYTLKATLPTTGVTPELPSAKNLTLKYITVGHGIQNYTCSAAGANATAAGALAVLWDIGHLYPKSGHGHKGGNQALTWQQWYDLPRDILRTTHSPINAIGTPENQYGAQKDEPFKPDADLHINGRKLPFLGHHTFDQNLIPTFDLYVKGDLFKGGKAAGVKAPKSADPGLLLTGAVDWLQLADSGKGLSKGLSINYRVVTAGGNPTKCTAADQQFSVPYAAMYWMYK